MRYLCYTAIVKNPIFHAKTKHIVVKYHFIRDVLEDKHMELVKVHTIENPTNLLVKALRIVMSLWALDDSQYIFVQ